MAEEKNVVFTKALIESVSDGSKEETDAAVG